VAGAAERFSAPPPRDGLAAGGACRLSAPLRDGDAVVGFWFSRPLRGDAVGASLERLGVGKRLAGGDVGSTPRGSGAVHRGEV